MPKEIHKLAKNQHTVVTLRYISKDTKPLHVTSNWSPISTVEGLLHICVTKSVRGHANHVHAKTQTCVWTHHPSASLDTLCIKAPC